MKEEFAERLLFFYEKIRILSKVQVDLQLLLHSTRLLIILQRHNKYDLSAALL